MPPSSLPPNPSPRAPTPHPTQHTHATRLTRYAREARNDYGQLGSKDLSELKSFVKGLPKLLLLDRLSDLLVPVAEVGRRAPVRGRRGRRLGCSQRGERGRRACQPPNLRPLSQPPNPERRPPNLLPPTPTPHPPPPTPQAVKQPSFHKRLRVEADLLEGLDVEEAITYVLVRAGPKPSARPQYVHMRPHERPGRRQGARGQGGP
jgi:hypothetical protein